MIRFIIHINASMFYQVYRYWLLINCTGYCMVKVKINNITGIANFSLGFAHVFAHMDLGFMKPLKIERFSRRAPKTAFYGIKYIPILLPLQRISTGDRILLDR